ncbi:MAG: GNAT family N-acetyltransferase [Ruminococcus sp.]|nr:GNAT family N-acetyltransferase [Ruminococcus sp.]
MVICIKRFEDLTARELYEILKARVDVFVVEQKCPYPELDGLDYESLHYAHFNDNGTVAAYLRMSVMDKDTGLVRMGRVLTTQRGTGLGGELLHHGIELARSLLDAQSIYIEAQTYAVGFYAREGFEVISEEFLEDGIPHVKMLLKL